MLNRIYKSTVKNMSTSKIRTAVIGGTMFSPRKFKAHIINKIKSGGISGRKLEEILKDEGMEKSQLSKRRRLMKALTGRDVEKLSVKEERRLAERVRARIAAARATSEMGNREPGGTAADLMRRKHDKGAALGSSLTTGEGENRTKVGMDSLNISNPHNPSNTAPSTGGHSAPPIGFNKMM